MNKEVIFEFLARKKMFKIGVSSTLISIVPSMLIPPLGSFLSKNFHPLYFHIG